MKRNSKLFMRNAAIIVKSSCAKSAEGSGEEKRMIQIDMEMPENCDKCPMCEEDDGEEM